ncbi:MAG: class I SAM-dependent methyltransferase [Proteobacteria bacterium]|nr:class I SAM-dependent methyltransferase [Pseudomonadota bacterium]
MNKNSTIKESGFDRKIHWENVYSDKIATEVSWYQQCPENSLNLILATGIEKSASIIDIGGGASTLVDFLLTAEYQNISVLDISGSAIEQAKQRLGKHANKVNWIEQDITSFVAEQKFDVWHDRAVFHFLTDADDRSQYVKSMSRSLQSGSHAIIATFNLDGPEKCSGLDIVRYSTESLSEIFSENFKLIETKTEEHKTPGGKSQSFVYCRFVRV